jgi:DNA modification methylase
MHPGIARGAIARWTAGGARVLDPFCGSGTVLVESFAAGRAAAGIDASPLAVLLAQVRTATLGSDGRARLVEAAAEIAEESAERARKRKRPESPSWAKREFARFHPHVALELLGLRELVMDTPKDEVGRALRLCFSSLLVKFMRSGPEAPRDGETKRIGRGVPSRFLADRAHELAQGLEALERRVPKGTPPPHIEDGDARNYPAVLAASIDLVLSSPPYAGTYDYADQHAVRFTWLGLPQKPFRNAQIGERATGLGSAPAAWRESRHAWLSEMGRVTKPGGRIILVVGDGVVGHAPEDARVALQQASPAVGLDVVAWASQARSVQDRRLQEIFAGKPRKEHIVLLARARQ